MTYSPALSNSTEFGEFHLCTEQIPAIFFNNS